MPRIVSLWFVGAVGGALALGACGPPQAAQRSPVYAAQTATPAGVTPSAEVPGRQQRVYLCGDPVLQDQVTSGGERLVPGTTCWGTVAPEAGRPGTAARPPARLRPIPTPGPDADDEPGATAIR